MAIHCHHPHLSQNGHRQKLTATEKYTSTTLLAKALQRWHGNMASVSNEFCYHPQIQTSGVMIAYFTA
jgi:hypothetical protein